MFCANPLHGNSATISKYRRADNYHMTYRRSEAGFENKFGGRLAAIVGIGEYSEEKFGAVLEGQYADGPDFKTAKRGEYKTLSKDERAARVAVEFNYSPPKSVSVVGLVFGNEDAIHAHRVACEKANAFVEGSLLETRMTLKEVIALQAQGINVQYKMVDKKNNMCRVKVDNFLVTSVLHTVSRVSRDGTLGGDPQVHSHDTVAMHCFFAGKLRSIDFGKVMRSQHLIDAVYKTELRAELERRGIECVESGPGNFEIAGFTRADVVVFSGGRARIKEFIERTNEERSDPTHPKHGEYMNLANSRHTQVANDATRGGKVDFGDHPEHSDPSMSLDLAQAWWRHKAAAAGLSVDEMKSRMEAAQSRARGAQSRTSEAARGEAISNSPSSDAGVVQLDKVNAQEAYDRAVGHLLERQSTIRDYETLLNEVIKRANYSIPIDDLKSAIQAKLDAGELIVRDDGVSLTTFHRVETELAIREHVERGIGTKKPLIDKRQFEEALSRYEAEKGFQLSEGQAAAARGVLMSNDETVLIIGRAGTGKSTSVELLKEILENEGHRIYGLAPSGKAVQALEDSINDKHDPKTGAVKPHRDPSYKPGVITSQRACLDERWWQKNIERKEGQTGETVVVVDEAGLIGSDDMLSLQKFAHQYGARLVFSGDTDQYSSVEAGSALNIIDDISSEKGSRFLLSQMLRAKDDTTLQLHYASLLDTEKSFDILADTGRVELIDDEAEAMKAIATEYARLSESERDNTFVITSRNTDRRLLNTAIRTELGLDEKDGIEFNSYERHTNWTKADLEEATNYEPGNTIFMNTKTGPFEKHEAVVVKEVLNRREVLVERTVEGEGGPMKELVRFDCPTMSKGVSVGDEEQVKMVVGERVRFTASMKSASVKNGDRGVVVNINYSERVLSIKLAESGRVVKVPVPKDGRGTSLRFGYAATGHSAQGGTAKNGGAVLKYAPLNSPLDRNSFYTDITRSVRDTDGHKSVKLYTNARGAEAVQKMMEKAGTPMRQDRALADVPVKRVQIRNAFVSKDGWKAIYADLRAGILSEQEYRDKPKSMLAKIKAATTELGTNELGIRGNLKFAKAVVKTLVDNRLEDQIKIVTTKKQLVEYRDELIQARERTKQARDAGEDQAMLAHLARLKANKDASIAPKAESAAPAGVGRAVVQMPQQQPAARQRPRVWQEDEYER